MSDGYHRRGNEVWLNKAHVMTFPTVVMAGDVCQMLRCESAGWAAMRDQRDKLAAKLAEYAGCPATCFEDCPCPPCPGDTSPPKPRCSPRRRRCWDGDCDEECWQIWSAT
jgi:hypothetical protein